MAVATGSGPLTVEERHERGRAAREECPRSDHAVWAAPRRRRDPVDLLEEQGETRVAELLPIRRGRMAVSAFTFYRGAAYVMASDLAATPRTGLEVQLCGDAHLSNFGGFAAPDRQLVFDCNDFDETLPGPWEWDVKRLAASLAVAGRAQGFDEPTRADIVAESTRAYRRTIREFAGMRNLDIWYARLSEADLSGLREQASHKAIKRAERNVAKARQKDSLRAFNKLTETVDGEPRLVSQPPLIVPARELFADYAEGDVMEVLREVLQAYIETLPPDVRQLVERYRMVDVARKVVGVGSVGTRAFIVLMLGRDDGDPLFLQVKEAQRSVIEPFTSASEFDNCGQRVVVGQRAMQAAGDIMLGWVRAEGPDGVKRDFYVRQLWDSKLSADVDAMDAPTLRTYGQICGWTMARAHARSGDPVVIGGYLGKGGTFDQALAQFAEAYAEQNQHDYEEFSAAIADGRLEAETGL